MSVTKPELERLAERLALDLAAVPGVAGSLSCQLAGEAERGTWWPPGGEAVLVRLGGHEFSVSASLEPEDFLVHAADRLIEDVVHEVGGPWPVRHGEVLRPALVDGVASWLGQSVVVPIGALLD